MDIRQREYREILEKELVVTQSRLQRTAAIEAVRHLNTVDRRLLQQALSDLQKITHAIARIDSGQYELCAKCRQSIESDRLRALPTTELCANCARKQKQMTIPPCSTRQLNSPVPETG